MTAQILLVEDDPLTRVLLTSLLEQAGYSISEAPDGETALTLLDQQQFDVVITDIHLGEVDGFEVLRVSKGREDPPAVILMTGYGSIESAIHALRAGAHDYVLKPIDPTDLLNRISDVLRRRANDLYRDDAARILTQGIARLQQRSTLPESADPDNLQMPRSVVSAQPSDQVIVLGALTIGVFRHAVSFNGQPLHLTPIEFTLLHYLAEARGRVIGYRELARHTHGYDTSDNEAQVLLKAHIYNLRRKIDPAYLTNERGDGYKLVAPANDPAD